MKKFVIILSVLIMGHSVQGQNKKNIRTDKIKSVTSWATENKKGKMITYKDSYEEFNSDGNSVLKIEYDKKSVVKYKETDKFDTKGNKTEETIYDTKTHQNLKRAFQYEAGVRSNCLEYDTIGKLIRKIVYSYDANGNKNGEKITDASGTPVATITEEYNNGKKISFTETGKDGTVIHKETANYNAFGNKTEMTESDKKDNIEIRITYKYNAFNDKSEECEYNKSTGALMQKISYSYNADGVRTTEIYTHAVGSMMKKIVYTYNNKKLKESKVIYDADGNIKTTKKYVYEYF